MNDFNDPYCTCPEWTNDDDFDGPEDYADACASCPVHGYLI